MVKSVTMVVSNKILSRGHSLLKLSITKVELKKVTVEQPYFLH